MPQDLHIWGPPTNPLFFNMYSETCLERPPMMQNESSFHKGLSRKVQFAWDPMVRGWKFSQTEKWSFQTGWYFQTGSIFLPYAVSLSQRKKYGNTTMTSIVSRILLSMSTMNIKFKLITEEFWETKFQGAKTWPVMMAWVRKIIILKTRNLCWNCACHVQLSSSGWKLDGHVTDIMKSICCTTWYFYPRRSHLQGFYSQ